MCRYQDLTAYVSWAVCGQQQSELASVYATSIFAVPPQHVPTYHTTRNDIRTFSSTVPSPVRGDLSFAELYTGIRGGTQQGPEPFFSWKRDSPAGGLTPKLSCLSADIFWGREGGREGTTAASAKAVTTCSAPNRPEVLKRWN